MGMPTAATPPDPKPKDEVIAELLNEAAWHTQQAEAKTRLADRFKKEKSA